MNRRISLLLILVTILLIASFSCKRNPVIPPEEEPTNCYYPAGNSNYTWRVDTVAWFPSTVGGVWAFSDSDAYVMGYIGEGKAPWRIFAGIHWDGKQWTTNINGTDEEVGHVANDVTGDDHFMVSVGNWYINPPKPAVGEFDNRMKKWKHYQFQTTGELRSVWTDGKGYFIAAGDNGMVYTKDGYMAEWVYQKVPTEFNFYKLTSVSKNEVYLLGYKSIGGITYPQIWRYDGKNWLKLLDDIDSAGTLLKIPETEHIIGDLYATRCGISDSLRLYIVGWESNLFETKGSSHQLKKTNLKEFGLPLRNIGRTAQRIFGFSPNDYWVFGTKYNYYHWNGLNFQQVNIQGFPSNVEYSGDNRRMIKTSSGKIFFPAEVSSQVYVIVQGIP
ncbi:MAG: hypothetical protein Q8N03_15465 [Ignavibacteria bacterium]|nr:hypothetical protein [Ignavibacteria bacterium]